MRLFNNTVLGFTTARVSDWMFQTILRGYC